MTRRYSLPDSTNYSKDTEDAFDRWQEDLSEQDREEEAEEKFNELKNDTDE